MARISSTSVQEIKNINPVQLLACSCNQTAKKYQSSSCLPKDRCYPWDKKLETSSCFLKSRKWCFRISFLLKINELFHAFLFLVFWGFFEGFFWGSLWSSLMITPEALSSVLACCISTNRRVSSAPGILLCKDTKKFCGSLKFCRDASAVPQHCCQMGQQHQPDLS